jgi:hypothetical protein
MRFIVIVIVTGVVDAIDLQAPFDGSLRTTRFSKRARRGTIEPVESEETMD